MNAYTQARDAGFAEMAARYEAENAAVESRKGELPKRDLTELRLLREQIEAARTERTTAKGLLLTLRDAKQAAKADLQTVLAAATKAPERQAVRAQIDAVQVEIDTALADLEAANAQIESLRQQREELLFEERLTKGELPDEAAIEERQTQGQLTDADKEYLSRRDRDELTPDEQRQRTKKQEQASLCEQQRAWLKKHQTQHKQG